LLLFAIGVPADDARIRRALGFLDSDYVSDFQWGFWRVAPMLRVPGYETTVQADLLLIERHIERHAGPSPDQPLTTFTAQAYQALEQHGKAEPHLREVLSAYSPTDAWNGRADATSHALSVLLRSPLAKEVPVQAYKTAVNLIVLQAARQGLGSISWGGKVSITSYTAMNILEAPKLAAEPRLDALLRGAAKYVLGRQDPETGLWPVESTPYGGDLEITNPDYYSAVALRGVVAISASRDPDFLLALWYSLERRVRNTACRDRHRVEHEARLAEVEAVRQRRSHMMWRAIALSLLLLLLAPQIVGRLPTIAEAVGLAGGPDADVRLGRYGSYASLIGLLLALVIPAVAALFRRSRRRSSQHRQAKIADQS
jgi:hypothetical protein